MIFIKYLRSVLIREAWLLITLCAWGDFHFWVVHKTETRLNGEWGKPINEFKGEMKRRSFHMFSLLRSHLEKIWSI